MTRTENVHPCGGSLGLAAHNFAHLFLFVPALLVNAAADGGNGRWGGGVDGGEGRNETLRCEAGGGRSWRDLSDVVGILKLANTTTSPEPGSLELKLLANQSPLGRRRDDRSLDQTPAPVPSSGVASTAQKTQLCSLSGGRPTLLAGSRPLRNDPPASLQPPARRRK